MDREKTERMQVEVVFGLTGGELNDDPWEPYSTDNHFGEARQYVATYNYDNVPEWAEEDFSTHESHWATTTYRTMVDNLMFGAPADVVYDGAGIWEKVATYANSGETECWCLDGGAIAPENAPKDCTLCEGSGYIYIGDGWAEIVYRLIGSEMKG